MNNVLGGHNRRLLFRSYLLLVGGLLVVAIVLDLGFGYLQSKEAPKVDRWLESTFQLIEARLADTPPGDRDAVAAHLTETLGIGVQLLSRDDVHMQETADRRLPPLVDASGTYLQTNFEFEDGARGFMHVTEADMPWVVAVARPPEPPTDGSSTEAREATIEAMRMWEAAIRPHVPWFRLAFVDRDRDAPVQVVWKRRIPGPWAGFGGMRVMHRDGLYRVGGELKISTTSGNSRVSTSRRCGCSWLTSLDTSSGWVIASSATRR